MVGSAPIPQNAAALEIVRFHRRVLLIFNGQHL
jgi:hypothetical protein